MGMCDIQRAPFTRRPFDNCNDSEAQRLATLYDSWDVFYAVLNDSPQPHVDTALGLLTTKPPPINFSAL